jgi:two-component system LytT family response regulator
MNANASRVRVLVVDDEPVAREHLRRLLADDREVEVTGDCGNGRDAIEAIRTHTPDLVLLDIQMPEVDGFGVIDAVGTTQMPLVIFVTAYDDYAVDAFRVSALDYLLKPIDGERLGAALARAKTQLRLGRPAENADRLAALMRQMETRGGSARIAVKVDGRVLFLRPEQIDWVEAVDDNVRLHGGGQSITVRETMAHLEARLPATRFMRIHRSTIVNIDRIREVQPWFQGNFVLILADGTKVTSGRSYRQKMQQFLEDAL